MMETGDRISFSIGSGIIIEFEVVDPCTDPPSCKVVAVHQEPRTRYHYRVNLPGATHSEYFGWVEAASSIHALSQVANRYNIPTAAVRIIRYEKPDDPFTGLIDDTYDDR